MSRKTARMTLTNGKLLRFDEDGNRIVDLTEPESYKPSYDLGISGKGKYGTEAPFTTRIYFDVDTELYRFTSKRTASAKWRALVIILLHKYIWRHFS